MGHLPMDANDNHILLNGYRDYDINKMPNILGAENIIIYIILI